MFFFNHLHQPDKADKTHSTSRTHFSRKSTYEPATTISETKKDEDMDPEETGYIEEIVNPSKNLLQELEEPTIAEGTSSHFST